MRIAVYCSASSSIDQKYLDLAFDIGVAIANVGADLVWGGGQISMMGAAAKGARGRGAKTFGVIPEKLVTVEFEDPEATEMFIVSNMRTRKAKIEELADASNYIDFLAIKLLNIQHTIDLVLPDCD